jgi:hypothetical protein
MPYFAELVAWDRGHLLPLNTSKGAFLLRAMNQGFNIPITAVSNSELSHAHIGH